MWFLTNIYEKMAAKPWACAIDIVLAALLIYGMIVFLKKNNAGRLIPLVIVFVAASIVLSSVEYTASLVFGWIMRYGILIVIIVIVFVFPAETKRGLLKLASPRDTHEQYTTAYDVSDEELHAAINDIVRAAQNMSKKNVGALIIISTQNLPEHIIDSGTKLDAVLSCALLESIFNTKAPLHDGAVFVRGNRIVAAGCFLPLSQSNAIDKELGTRHRAGIGVSENYNVLTIIVSEETGVISIAQHGELTRYFDSQMLTDKLEQTYGLQATPESTRKHHRRKEG
ncbi:MAG: diadenylate cyclase CdaA [Clostridiales bacterium]|nr:diadenylate cyclase CdaA [Clostridiales bacterium]